MQTRKIEGVQKNPLMGKPTPGCIGSEFQACPPIYLREFWEHSQTIWGGLSTNLKKNFFVSEISADPQKRPYGVKGASSRVKNDPNFLVKIYIKFIIS